jgi:hypothetical protein
VKSQIDISISAGFVLDNHSGLVKSFWTVEDAYSIEVNLFLVRIERAFSLGMIKIPTE